jgi:hypothetical protein
MWMSRRRCIVLRGGFLDLDEGYEWDMYVYVFMYVYVCMYVYAFMYVYVYVCMCIHV